MVYGSVAQSERRTMTSIHPDDDPYAEQHIPPHIRVALDDYAGRRWEPEYYLIAILENNLKEAFGRADHITARAMPAIVSSVYCKLPIESQGSPEKVKAWLAGAAIMEPKVRD